MSNIEPLTRIKQQALSLIAEITAQPKPTYKVDGQNVAWSEYLAQLQATVEWCDRQFAAERPCEVKSRGYT